MLKVIESYDSGMQNEFYILYSTTKVSRAWIDLAKEQNTTWMWSDGPVNYTNPSLTEDHPPDGVVWAGLVTAGPNGRWEHDDKMNKHHFICQKAKSGFNFYYNPLI